MKEPDRDKPTIDEESAPPRPEHKLVERDLEARRQGLAADDRDERADDSDQDAQVRDRTAEQRDITADKDESRKPRLSPANSSRARTDRKRARRRPTRLGGGS